MVPPMDGSDLFAVVIVVAALVFQIWVTLQVYRSELYDAAQKRAQTRLIWMVPLVGALVSFVVLTESGEPRRDSDRSERP